MVKTKNNNKENMGEIFHVFTLNNGLRIIYRPTTSKVTYCGYAINAGTRDEEENELGMAHFVEHLIFKGTQKRKACHILNYLSNVGGDIDAFTNKEETIVYATVLNKDFERALELLSDIVFHSTFPTKEIQKETEVILNEIKSYDDNPSELIYDDFENIIYNNHSLGRNILGSPQMIKRFTTANALSFTERFYQPDNMAFFVSGDLNFKHIIHLVEKYTGSITTVSNIPNRIPPTSYQTQHVEVNKNTHQAHIIIGCQGYKTYDGKAAGLYLLNNILGGPAMNNRLNLSLREHTGLVYTVESSITSYTDTGVFCIYFATDTKDIDRCMQLTKKELQKLRENKLTSQQLSIAKKQLIGQIGIASDNDENNALDMAKYFLHYQRYDTLEETYHRIETITAEDLLEIANEKLGEDNLSTLMYH